MWVDPSLVENNGADMNKAAWHVASNNNWQMCANPCMATSWHVSTAELSSVRTLVMRCSHSSGERKFLRRNARGDHDRWITSPRHSSYTQQNNTMKRHWLWRTIIVGLVSGK